MKTKYILIFTSIVLICAAASYYFLRPSLNVDHVLPSGAIAYVHVTHLNKHWQDLEHSEFYKRISVINLGKVLKHNNIPEAKVNEFASSQKQFIEILNNPLFIQVFGQEIAMALYPSTKGEFNAQNWIFISRIGTGAQIAEFLTHLTHGQE